MRKILGTSEFRLARVAMLVSAVAVTVTGCGLASDHTSAPPGSGGPVPGIRLEAVEHKLDQLQNWARPRADRFAIPLRALQAYGYATVVLAKAQPNCHLGWTTLAGIARVESNHARFGGASIAADGSVRPVIRGVALDGTGGNAVIVDPSATARTGKTVSARAMGPFQFIPDTWARWGIRADADYSIIAAALESGKPVPAKSLSGSPDNIDDAAVAAGRYLCAAGGDLATATGWRQAILAYNQSSVYVDQVRAAASRYDA
ncbi:hypothetical protein DFR70_114122 [Nocardia tenerifensis]|uniref:Transglycosylase protein with SLT domain n=1 Tax=Nocardia tenerifensis TaxID=228006 RepID=A0A318K5S0_9NOCA|nr:hypothetical protein [Nocardia tenerifensis]PXX58438.1 hypothetical protein DFR70_114122 [Nocardia tenerifensis]